MFKKKKKVEENEYCLTATGKRFRQYLLDKKNGEEYTIVEYEESIEDIMKQCGCSREEAINDFLASIPKIPNINIFRNDIKTLLIDMDYADSVLESPKEYIKTDSVMSELASYSCYYAWENIIGIMICLYQGIFSNSGLFEVIKNAADS